MARWLIGAVVVAACGDGGSIPLDTARSGTRLRLSWYEFSDGTRTWDTEIIDSKLGTTCVPQKWADGELRCTPLLPVISFVDDACTQPMILGTEASHALERATLGCGQSAPSKMYAATAEPVSTPVAFGRDEAGVCRAIPKAPNMVSFTGRVATALGTPDLVGLSYVYPGSEHLRIETLAGDDTLLLPLRPYDAKLEVGCDNFDNLNFNTNAMADMTSVPCQLESRSTEVFADLACEVPGIWASAEPSCAHERFASLGLGPCREFFTIGDTPQAFGFQSLASSCFETTRPEGTLLYASTGAIEPLVLQRAAAPGPNRLHVIYLGDSTTQIRERTLFYDSELDTECELHPERGGACEPVSRTSGNQRMFTDAACTQEVYVTYIGENSEWDCTAYRPRRYSGYGGDYRPILDAQPGPLYEFTLDFGCRAFAISNATAYALGPPVTTPLVAAAKRRD